MVQRCTETSTLSSSHISRKPALYARNRRVVLAPWRLGVSQNRQAPILLLALIVLLLAACSPVAPPWQRDPGSFFRPCSRSRLRMPIETSPKSMSTGQGLTHL